MKEFKYCHEEITEGVEIPVTVCETQKEMVAGLIMQKDCFDFAAVRMNAVEEKRIKGYFNLSDGTLDRYAYREAMDEAISGTDEEMMYIIYKDGSEYWNGADEVHGKFKRYGIKRAIISTPWGYTVFGDFAINDMGDVTIEESEIEEYGVYAGQYDVKEQEAQGAVEQTTEAEPETEETVEQEAEQEITETADGISKTKTATETDDSGFEYTTSQAQEVIMAGTSIAREKYREKHNIHSPMDLKKFSKKQLDDYLSKELDYINKFLNDTIPKEVFNAMKGETMCA